MSVSVRDSILKSVKISLGIVPEYTEFDNQIIMLINTAFSVLTQLGCGPEEGFSIEGEDETWADYIEDNKKLNMVVTYVHTSVMLAFDPPSSSFALQAAKDRLAELSWRINMEVDP